jgi:septal ring factor EnvC (AmiA/AmiB activator)
MPEEKKEEHQAQETPGGAPESDGSPGSEGLDAIKAELEEERKARAAVDAALAEKDALIADLQAQVSEVLSLSETKAKELESTTAELAQLRETHSQAVAKYLDAVKLANPAIPGDVIAGQTIEDIDGSVRKATAIAAAVEADLEARAREARVPAGAPARGEISIDGLSPREKIAAGIQQKGGTS